MPETHSRPVAGGPGVGTPNACGRSAAICRYAWCGSKISRSSSRIVGLGKRIAADLPCCRRTRPAHVECRPVLSGDPGGGRWPDGWWASHREGMARRNERDQGGTVRRSIPNRIISLVIADHRQRTTDHRSVTLYRVLVERCDVVLRVTRAWHTVTMCNEGRGSGDVIFPYRSCRCGGRWSVVRGRCFH